ncbi:SDR family NAD(P)-dependent oxidoreductase [Variovorax ginsengisoli]|uniref:Short-subunit dehydrogenase n=1 Tax=Variovorax ginsengisoli TaxID=363844 RepID=A0ABT9S7D0_9BURK|nr:SDR family NAD(P)-dependent oxidoreductase [Variovorax ginsengisoli]MDP9900270.1 short-subunit dehydrogenase [Variovorax ginsengisoli]
MRLLAPYNPPIADWRDKRVWIVGASSGIGHATAVALLAQGARVTMSARQRAPLDALAARHPALATVLPLDVTDADAVRQAHAALVAQGPVDFVLYCAGTYQALRADAFALDVMVAHQQVNYVGALHVLAVVLPDFVARGAGHVALTASVAGFRGLPQSLAYGPTKAALTNLAEVLYADLHRRGIGVSVVQPGFVETPLTAQNEFRMPALIQPAEAAADMLAGWAAGDFEIHFPKRFTWWMKLLRVLPYRLYFAAVQRVTGL